MEVMENKYIGSSLDEFLADEGLLAGCKAAAAKRLAASELNRKGTLKGALICTFIKQVWKAVLKLEKSR